MIPVALPLVAASSLSGMFAGGGVLTVIDPDLARVIGWTGVHFLWQGTLIAAALACLRRRQQSAETRHATAVFAMLFMLAAPAVTAFFLRGIHGQGGAHGATALRALADGLSGAASTSVPLPEAGAFGWIAAAWVLGTSIMLVRLLLHLSHALGLRAGSSRTSPPGWQATLDLLRIQLGIRRPIRIALHPRILAPIVVGCLRPMVLVPVSALTGLTPDQLRAVLAHELAHVRRLDPFINAVQALFESLLFFHPPVWWVYRQIRVEREFCCDDAAVMVCGDSLVYARALSLLADLGAEERRLAIASTGGSLMDRIRRIVKCETAPRAASSRPTMVAALGAAALTVAVLTAGVASAGLDPDPCDKACCKKAGAAANDERIHALLQAMEDIGFDRATRDRVLGELQRQDEGDGAALRQDLALANARDVDAALMRSQRKEAERAALEHLLAAEGKIKVLAETNALKRALELAQAEKLLAESHEQTLDRTKAELMEVEDLFQAARLKSAARQADEARRETANRSDQVEALLQEIRAREEEIRSLKAKLEGVHTESANPFDKILEQRRAAQRNALEKRLSDDSADALMRGDLKEALRRYEDARRAPSEADRAKAQDEALTTKDLFMKKRSSVEASPEQRARFELERARVAEMMEALRQQERTEGGVPKGAEQ